MDVQETTVVKKVTAIYCFFIYVEGDWLAPRWSLGERESVFQYFAIWLNAACEEFGDWPTRSGNTELQWINGLLYLLLDWAVIECWQQVARWVAVECRSDSEQWLACRFAPVDCHRWGHDSALKWRPMEKERSLCMDSRFILWICALLTIRLRICSISLGTISILIRMCGNCEPRRTLTVSSARISIPNARYRQSKFFVLLVSISG